MYKSISQNYNSLLEEEDIMVVVKNLLEEDNMGDISRNWIRMASRN